MKRFIFSIIMMAAFLVGHADTYSDGYRWLDLSTWTSDDTSFDTTTGRLSLNRVWGSHKKNFGKLTTGIAGQYLRLIVELTEPVAFDNIIVWTCQTEPWNDDRIDVSLTKGDSYFSILLPDGYISQLGIACTDQTVVESGAYLMVKSVRLEENASDRTNLNMNDASTCFDNFGAWAKQTDGGYTLTSWGWAGFWWSASHDSNDFISLKVNFKSPTPGRLSIAMWNGDASNLWGNNDVKWLTADKGVTSIDIPIDRQFNCIAFNNPDYTSEEFYFDEIYLERQQLKYELDGNDAKVVGSNVTKGTITIPSTTIIDGTTRNVTAIGDGAFSGLEYIEGIVIPEGVKSIGASAFASTWISSITIPSSVETIGDEAFWNCHELSSVSLGNEVKEIGNRAFGLCTALTEIQLPESLTNLSDGCFTQDEQLGSIVLPSSIKGIGNQTFEGCSLLQEMTIPATIGEIGMYAFSGCDGIKRLTLEGAPIVNHSYDGLPNDCQLLYNYDYRNSSNLPEDERLAFYDYIPLGKNGFTTYYADHEFTLPLGFNGAVINEVNHDKMSLNWAFMEGDIVPAKTALIIKYDQQDNYVVLHSQPLSNSGNLSNLLRGSVDSETIRVEGDNAYFTLQEKDGEMIMKREKSDFTNQSRGVYLCVPISANPSDSYKIDGTAVDTSIDATSVESNNAPQRVYNLQGVRLSSTENLSPGIYIINGKKTIKR